MAQNPWQRQFKQLLARASEEFKRTGEELKTEAQRLIGEVRDPANQQKMKEGLKDLGVWAKKTADQAAEAIDAAVKKAEATWKKDAEEAPAPKAPKASPKPPAAKAPKAEPTEAAPQPKPAAKAPVKKTVGKKQPAGTAPKGASGKAPAAKNGAKPAAKAPAKSIGKKKPKSS